uniref:Serpentine receptor class gamma n=1 Tax=Panagrellus redivivus TaxID=6233 RepID=A0A7E4ZX92_PANRE
MRSAENHEAVVLRASSETHGALEAFYNESSLMYVPENGGLSRSIIRIAFFTSVIYSGIIVIVLTWQWLFYASESCPQFILTFSWGFTVPNTSYIGSWFIMLMSFHGIIDELATLYFVTPYRKFCKKLLRKAWPCKSAQTEALNLAPSSGFTSEPLAP